MKIKLGEVPLVYPVPIVLAGANVKGKPNYVTLGDCGIMGLRPPLVYISLHQEHFTTQGVFENKTFSVNLPNTDNAGGDRLLRDRLRVGRGQRCVV